VLATNLALHGDELRGGGRRTSPRRSRSEFPAAGALSLVNPRRAPPGSRKRPSVPYFNRPRARGGTLSVDPRARDAMRLSADRASRSLSHAKSPRDPLFPLSGSRNTHLQPLHVPTRSALPFQRIARNTPSAHPPSPRDPLCPSPKPLAKALRKPPDAIASPTHEEGLMEITSH
jgi:hypothetical protein